VTVKSDGSTAIDPIKINILYNSFGVFDCYLLTYSMEQSPSSEANWSAASQEILRIL